MKDFKLECIIYALICPITKEIRYIGKTKHSLKRRLSVHIRQKSKCKKSLWIKSLIEKKLVPEIILIENCSNKNWKQREIYHISLYDNLLNQNKGGAGGLNEKNDYIKIYKENISLRKGKSTIYNYLSVVSKFLKHFNSVCLNPIWINKKMIEYYINTIPNTNTRNSTIIALKDFYTNVINQPNKLKYINYGYSKMAR